MEDQCADFGGEPPPPPPDQPYKVILPLVFR
jgi:hypothetical protein